VSGGFDRPRWARWAGWARYRRAARALLIAVLLADAVVAFIALPNSADLGLLASAVNHGRVVVINGAPRSPTVGPVPLWSVPSAGVEWSDSDGHRWLTQSGGGVDGLAQLVPGFRPGRGLLPVPNDLLDAVGRGDPLGVVRSVLDLLAAFAWLVMLVVLLAGPPPRRATRWGWVWLFALPLSIGGLWWLLRESPWSARPAPSPVPDASPGTVAGGLLRRDGRLGGWPALILAATSGAIGTGLLGVIPALTPAGRGALLVLAIVVVTGVGAIVASRRRAAVRHAST
jgi:hypothetical protein